MTGEPRCDQGALDDLCLREQGSRPMAPLKIFEVDEHHHVLLSEEITSAFQEKAGKGGILLNFDSHDDWGMSLVRHTKLWLE